MTRAIMPRVFPPLQLEPTQLKFRTMIEEEQARKTTITYDDGWL